MPGITILKDLTDEEVEVLIGMTPLVHDGSTLTAVPSDVLEELGEEGAIEFSEDRIHMQIE